MLSYVSIVKGLFVTLIIFASLDSSIISAMLWKKKVKTCEESVCIYYLKIKMIGVYQFQCWFCFSQAKLNVLNSQMGCNFKD